VLDLTRFRYEKAQSNEITKKDIAHQHSTDHHLLMTNAIDKKLSAAVRRIEKMIAVIALGTEDYREQDALVNKAFRAVDRLPAVLVEREDGCSYPDYTVERELRTRVREARDAGAAAVRAALLDHADVARREALRARPIAGSYEHEVALARAGLR
jgi:hypothetical protein